ncbi:MAG: sigma 54-interacting transcriptional regulator [Planctomycetota bacterium]
MAGLLIKTGPNKGSLINLNSRRVALGRAPASDVQFRDRTVSREHAVLVQRDGAWYVQDVGSHNRVLVNGVPVVSSLITHMDEIRLGSVVLTFLMGETEGDETRTVTETETSTEVTQVIPVGEPAGATAQQDRRLNHLLTLGGLASAVRTLPALLEGVASNLESVLEVGRVILILQAEDGTLRPYVTSRREFGEDIAELGVERSLVERARRDGPVAARRRGGRPGSMACVPISVGTEDLGAIYCETQDGQDGFCDEDLRHLFSIGVGLGLAIKSVRMQQKLASRSRSLSRQLAEHYDMVGESEAMGRVYRFIHRAAPTEAGVFICGESGSGKEMVARAIHRHSRRSEGPLEIVNCAAVPTSLMESALFGHVKGAFTGAVADRPGRFRLAHEGTLFLDEVAELPLACQAKLLRVLEEHRIRPVGDTKDQEVDVRLIAATNRDPRTAVSEGRLREDLFYRLDRLRIVVPPLREREGDIDLLARHFLEKLSKQCKNPVEAFSAGALQILRSYHWPGNVRELRNVVERMVIMADSPVLGEELVPEDIREAARNRDAPPDLEQVEREHIVRTLEHAEGNKTRAAELLGIDRSTLYAKIKKYDL